MTSPSAEDTEELLRRASRGEASAVHSLFDRNRERLKRMVSLRMDRRLVSRIDASDVVQETLLAAHERLQEYLKRRPVGFYPWLRRIAWERLADLHRAHIHSQRRSVNREDPMAMVANDQSTSQMADCLRAMGSGPGGRLTRKELCLRVQAALARLTPTAREVLMLRFVEQMSVREASEVMNVSESAFKGRQVRALDRLREMLSAESGDIRP